MSFFDFFRQPDINRGVNDFRNTPGAVLLDVRTPQEHREGHIPGSQNVPLQTIDNVRTVAEKKDTPLYVYCHSGGRSRQAVQRLGQMGYSNVTNIGGIAAYRGKVE
ncbi:MAG: rhodanese-like domain-containing protein [Oscillospiraceae bacterium]|nr:rhodanese-like domain-containing protein [Oscillospiraceae bacterium]